MHITLPQQHFGTRDQGRGYRRSFYLMRAKSSVNLVQSYRSTSKQARRHLPINSQNELCNLAPIAVHFCCGRQNLPQISCRITIFTIVPLLPALEPFFFFPPYTVPLRAAQMCLCGVVQPGTKGKSHTSPHLLTTTHITYDWHQTTVGGESTNTGAQRTTS